MTTNNPTLSEAGDAFITYMESRRDKFAVNTVIGYRTRLRQMVRAIGDIKMTSLTPQHMEKWFYGPGGLMQPHMTGTRRTYIKQRQGLAASTHNVYRAQCITFFDWCRKQGWIKKDLMSEVDRMKEEQNHRQRPPAPVLVSLLDYAKNPRDRCYIALALNTALRSSEITPILVGHVNLADGWIEVTIGKSRKVDTRPITEDLDEELRRWMVIYAESIGRPLDDEDYLFPAMTGNIFGTMTIGPNGEKVQTRTNGRYHPLWQLKRAERVVQHALKEAGLKTHYEGTHTLRRAVARAYFDMLVAEGTADIAALRMTSALLNHSMVSTTERYLGLDLEREKRDRSLRGKPFLSAMVGKQDNVISLADRKPS